MIFDWDDFRDDVDSSLAFALLCDLHAKRPDFRCTLFAIPGGGNWDFWQAIGKIDWIELVPHGWDHPDPHECDYWSRERMLRVMDEPVVQAHFVRGFKAPGWQISDGCYEALLERGWWVADQPYNNGRRPAELRVHLLGSPGHWHGHIGNVCGNGIRETWDEVHRLVSEAESFEFMSEAVGMVAA